MSAFSKVTVKEYVSSVNQCIDNLTVKRADGKHVPWDCISCDELLIPRKAQHISPELLRIRRHLFQVKDWNEMVEGDELLRASYVYDDEGAEEYMKDLVLSLRSSYQLRAGGGGRKGFPCCTNCINAIEKHYVPENAIGINYMMGELPDCMKKLTDVELSFFFPVKLKDYYLFTR